MNLTKEALAKKIVSETNMRFTESKLFLDTFIENIITFSKLGRVKISSFGTFDYKFSPQRIGRNPKTKEVYDISKRYKLKLITSSLVKELLN